VGAPSQYVLEINGGWLNANAYPTRRLEFGFLILFRTQGLGRE